MDWTMVIQLAEKRIEIRNLYPYMAEYCCDYTLQDTDDCDIEIRITQEDIVYERQKSEQEDIAEGIPIRQFSEEYLETLAVYRKVAEQMPFYDTFLFHGSAIALDGTGYLFTAKSGTGKSTHTRLWRELLGRRATMINDDKPLIRVNIDGSAVIYGTPWDGKHRLSNPISVPLKAICILERAETNRIREITKQEALPMLFQQAYRPMDTGAMQRTIALIERLHVKLYRLGCNMDPSAAELSYHTMKG